MKTVGSPAYFQVPTTQMCQGDIISLNIFQKGCTYLWQDGSTSPAYIITQAGHYAVSISNGVCPAITDTFSVKVLDRPYLPSFHDTGFCPGDTFRIDVGQPGCTYLWQDGSTSPRYTITSAGKYTIAISNGNCKASASFKVVFNRAPEVPAWKDTLLCQRETLPLYVQPFGGHTLWQDGNRDSVYFVHDSGTYYVLVTNNCGSARDTIHVKYQECPFYLYIPNAFSPDDDALNEVFKPIMSYPPTNYAFIIYNRWGERVFSTEDYKTGWDGTFKGITVPEGAYVYMVNAYNHSDNQHYYRSGMVYVLRR